MPGELMSIAEAHRPAAVADDVDPVRRTKGDYLTLRWGLLSCLVYCGLGLRPRPQ
jgi:hypothetical protein